MDKAGVHIENQGTMPMSAMGEIEYTDGTSSRFRKTAEVWKTGNAEILIPVDKGKTVKEVRLGDPLVSDTDAKNNVWKMK